MKDINFEVKHGEVLGIIGRNGAGKSTLLKILARITRPTTGRFELNGRVGSLLEVGTGFHPELTGRDNIYLSGAILGMKRKEINRKFDEIVDFAEIEKFLDTPVKHYSSGMYMRLAFSVAAHLEPEILLVDEVLAVGDAEFQKKCLGKMGDVAGEGRTVLFVSHNMGAVEKLCGNCLVIKNGKKNFFGEVHSAINHYLTFENNNQKPKILLTEDKNLPIQLTEIRITNYSGENNFDFYFDEKLLVILKLKVHSEISRIYVAFHVINSELQTLIFSRDFESDINRLSKKWLPGEYEYTIYIPEKIFIPGTYSLSIHLASSIPPRVFNGLDNVCPFTINDKGSIRSQTGFPWAGKIGIPIDWELQKLD